MNQCVRMCLTRVSFELNVVALVLVHVLRTEFTVHLARRAVVSPTSRPRPAARTRGRCGWAAKPRVVKPLSFRHLRVLFAGAGDLDEAQRSRGRRRWWGAWGWRRWAGQRRSGRRRSRRSATDWWFSWHARFTSAADAARAVVGDGMQTLENGQQVRIQRSSRVGGAAGHRAAHQGLS